MIKLSNLRKILNDNQVASYINNTTAGQTIRGLSNGCNESRLIRRILGPLIILNLVVDGTLAGFVGCGVYRNKERIKNGVYQKLKPELEKWKEVPCIDIRGYI